MTVGMISRSSAGRVRLPNVNMMLTEVLAFAQCGNLATPIRSPSRGVSCERGRRAQTRGSARAQI